MTDDRDKPLHLLARLPIAVRGHGGASNDPGAAWEGPAEARCLHVTLAVLSAIDAPQDYLVQLIGWVMATIPPFAFRVPFDELIVSTRSTLRKASKPMHGALACQAHVAAMLRTYGVELPRQAMPAPQVTLGCGGREPLPTHGADAAGWLVEELVLVRGPAGRPHDVVLGQWRLPLAPGEQCRTTPSAAKRA